jgi:uncharacterized protein (TIGR02246 family)
MVATVATDPIDGGAASTAPDPHVPPTANPTPTLAPAPAAASARAAGAEAAIRGLYADLLATWGRGDGRAYGDLFTADADYVAFDGSRTVGAAAIGESHQRLFATWLKGTRLVGDVTAVRFLAPGVAVVLATGATLMPGRDRPVRPSIQTLVAVEGGGGWRFASFHNTRVVHRSPLGWIWYGISSKLFDR